MLPAFKPLPKVTIARYFSPVRGAHRILSGAWQKLPLVGEMFMHTRSIKSRAGDHSAKIGGRPLWSPYCSQPSARFRNWCRGGRFRRRGRRGHVFVDEIPDRHRDEKRDQLRAPVFQRQSGPQDGNQYRAPVLRGLSRHNCCAAKFSARNQNHTLPSRSTGREKNLPEFPSE